MKPCFFVSDLHGCTRRWETLFRRVAAERPVGVFLGGDLLPSPLDREGSAGDEEAGFVAGYLCARLRELRRGMGPHYPPVFVILGNDDSRAEEGAVLGGEAEQLWTYVHMRQARLNEHPVYGYAFVPPSPFLLKDWERYDVSRYVDPGCVSPEEGIRYVPVAPNELRYATIAADLEALAGEDPLAGAVMLFHCPPHGTRLDLSACAGKRVEGVPLDPHLGSVAIRRFIERRQPRITLHGHVHEAARLSGSWHDRLGQTHAFSAAHDGPELALVRFDPGDPSRATRELI